MSWHLTSENDDDDDDLSNAVAVSRPGFAFGYRSGFTAIPALCEDIFLIG